MEPYGVDIGRERPQEGQACLSAPMAATKSQPTNGRSTVAAVAVNDGQLAEGLEDILSAASNGERLGVIVQRLRKEQGLSGSELAKQVGTSRQWISRIETGEFKDIPVDKLARVLGVLGASADAVLQEAGYLTPQPEGWPQPRAYVSRAFGLKGKNLDFGIEFLEFLQTKGAKPASGS